jgi:hypothetical protein
MARRISLLSILQLTAAPSLEILLRSIKRWVMSKYIHTKKKKMGEKKDSTWTYTREIRLVSRCVCIHWPSWIYIRQPTVDKSIDRRAISFASGSFLFYYCTCYSMKTLKPVITNSLLISFLSWCLGGDAFLGDDNIFYYSNEFLITLFFSFLSGLTNWTRARPIWNVQRIRVIRTETDGQTFGGFTILPPGTIFSIIWIEKWNGEKIKVYKCDMRNKIK